MHYITANIKKLMDKKGLSLSAFARETGVSKATLSRWFSSNKRPRWDMIEKIAAACDVPLDYFVDDSFTEYWEENDGEWAFKDAPTYEVAAGQGRMNEGYETISGSNKDTSIIKIVGDSMYPVLHDGDIVTIKHQPETAPTDLTVIKINGDESTIKHVEVTDTGVWVRAINKDVFEDRFYTVREVMTLPVTIIGKAIELRRGL